MVNVYVACNLSDKVILWKVLSNVKAAYQDLAWCFCGDFNAMRSINERRGIRERNGQSSEISSFNSFINNNFLLELPLLGKKYTWFKSNGSGKSRLDRVLVS